ncbi:MAG: phosphate--AMP phosphotransferase, partial [Lachnospiraceae bacterium]|nr:phosphate--AMP phosphotransferase [Lachnospiraceae bacterium]
MLKEVALQSEPAEEELQAQLQIEKAKLAGYQNKIKEAKLPVMVIFEGWGAAGKGSVIGKVIRNIDPRFFKVTSMEVAPTKEEKRYPFMHRYMKVIPEAGKFAFFDTFWMKEVVTGVRNRSFDEKAYRKRIES